MPCPRLAAPALLVLLAWPAPGAQGDVVTTKDGVVLEGPSKRGPDGSVVVTTASGAVRVAAGEVASVAPGEGPRTALEREGATLAADDAVAHFALAARAEAAGLVDLARRH